MAGEKFKPNVIKIPSALIRFARLHKAEARTGRDGKPRGEPKFSCTAVLDPTNAIHATVIKEVKTEAARALNHRYGSQDQWPKPNPETGLGGLYYCFGLGNNLSKVYEGFKDMWYLKLSDKNRPLLWNRRHEAVIEGDTQCPYDGCISNISTTLWTYDNESRGLGANLREIQFVKDGKAFGGASRGGDDFAALGDDESAGSTSAAGKDPFDE